MKRSTTVEFIGKDEQGQDIFFNKVSNRYYYATGLPVVSVNKALDGVEGPDGFKSDTHWGEPFTKKQREERGLN
jgi:hypothetical protein